MKKGVRCAGLEPGSDGFKVLDWSFEFEFWWSHMIFIACTILYKLHIYATYCALHLHSIMPSAYADLQDSSFTSMLNRPPPSPAARAGPKH